MVIYLLASGLGGSWIGKIVYTLYVYMQVIAIGDVEVTGLFWYQLIGFIAGFAIGRYWQTHYEYWSSMRFIPTATRR